MKKYFTLLVYAVAISILGTACVPTNSETGKPRSTGETNTILVVTNSKYQWEQDTIGSVIREGLAVEMEGLPQSEPRFDFLNISQKSLNDLFKKFHNIFIVDIDKNRENVLVETKNDLWSYPQRVIKITAPSEEAFIEKFTEQKEAYIKLYDEMERERIRENFSMASNIKTSNTLIRDYGIYLAVPGGFRIVENAGDFIWLRHTVQKAKQDAELGIMIYTYDYTDTAAFNLREIINQRNKRSIEHISGPTLGSYMVTALRHVPPVSRWAEEFPADYAVETRGLWELVNDFMGGPYINYTILDEAHNRIIVLDGYVYYPNQPKRNYIRQLESIFHTFMLQEKE